MKDDDSSMNRNTSTEHIQVRIYRTYNCLISTYSLWRLLEITINLWMFCPKDLLQLGYWLGLVDSSDSVTIVIISVTIATVIAKSYYHDSDMWLQACAFDIALSQHIHNHVKNMQRWWGIFLIRSILKKSCNFFC